MSDQPDIQNIVSDNNIITNEKTTFKPTKTQTNETVKSNKDRQGFYLHEVELTKIQLGTLAEKGTNTALETVADLSVFGKLFPQGTVTKGIKNVIKNAGEQTVKEGLTETAQEGVSVGIEKLLGLNQGNNAERLLEAGIMGGLVGCAIGGGATLISQPYNTQFEQAQKQAQEQETQIAKEYINEVEKNGGNGASAIADEIVNRAFYAPTIQEQQGGMLVNPQQNTSIVPYNMNTQLVPTQQEQIVQNNNIPLLQGRVEQNIPLSTDNLIQQIAPNIYEKQRNKTKKRIKQNTEDIEYKQLREDAETIVKEAIRKSYPNFSDQQVKNYLTRVTKGNYNNLQSQRKAEEIYNNITDKLDDKISGLSGLPSFPELNYNYGYDVDYQAVMEKALDILSGEYVSLEEEWSLRENEKYEYFADIINGIKERLDNAKTIEELWEIYNNAENELPFELRTEETFNELLERLEINAERIEQENKQGRTQENVLRNDKQTSKFDSRPMETSNEEVDRRNDYGKSEEERLNSYQKYNQSEVNLKNKYLITENVYDNFVQIQKENNLIEQAPEYWQGSTIEEAKEFLNFGNKKFVEINSPVGNIKIYEQHLKHLIDENNSYRKKYLNRAIETIKKPNLIVKNGVYNNFIKLFYDDKNNIKPHLQIVKVKDDGNFYVTTLKPSKSQIKNAIIEGQVIYDLSSLSDTRSADNFIIANSDTDFKSDVIFDETNPNIYYQKDKYLISDENKTEIQGYKNFVNKVFKQKLTNKEKSKPYIIGNTPKSLTEAGLSDDKLAIGFSIIEKAKNEKNSDHKLSETTIENIVEALHNPIAVIKDEIKTNEKSNNRYGIILDLKENDNFVMVSIESGKNLGSGNIVNDIRTIHSRKSFAPMVNKAVNANRLLKIKESKLKDLFLGYQSDSISDGGQTSPVDIIKQKYKNTNILFQSAYHGSAKDFDRFDLSYALSGEGAMAHGYGVYVAKNKEVSEGYRKRLIPHNFDNIGMQITVNQGIRDVIYTKKQLIHTALVKTVFLKKDLTII